MSRIVVSQITIYPVKSAGGVTLPEAEVTPRGLALDRRWMLVDPTGRFLSQRQLPRLALVGVHFASDSLLVTAPGMAPLRIPLEPEIRDRCTVQVWEDAVQAAPTSPEADAWFSAFLGAPCRLVVMPDDAARKVDPSYGGASDQVGFADGFPFLLISEASLADLNSRLEQPLPMNRFRPNLVVSGCVPYAEDGWKRLRIGSLTFRVVKPCARCVITTTDQTTAVVGHEPLRTLASYRRVGRKVLFGQNLIHDGPGVLRVGDAVEIL